MKKALQTAQDKYNLTNLYQDRRSQNLLKKKYDFMVRTSKSEHLKSKISEGLNKTKKYEK